MSLTLRAKRSGRVDRTKPLSFTFDGKTYRGFEGDTLASALLANGVHLMGRSFKYHRPRGVVTAGSDEPNALVSVGTGARHTPNLRAPQVELFDGLVAKSQNAWPSLSFDVGAINNFLSPLFVAGFYYKTFMWPNVAWKKLYEPIIRRAAGLGTASNEPDPDHYSTRFAHCDVLVVGSGPAGLSAALSAARTGARVILCDEQSEFGGSLLSELHATVDGKPAAQWVEETVAELAGLSGTVTLLARTQAFGYFAQNFVGLVEKVTDHLAKPDPKLPRDRLWQVRAKQVVIATGAHERPMVFPDNDRPGIMLADAARTYANRYGVRPGGRAVVATAHDSAYQAALDLKAAGVSIELIADLRKEANGPLPTAARAAGIRVETGMAITGSTGSLRVKAALVSKLGTDGEDAIPCDLILMCGGWTPSVHLFSQSRGKLVFDDARQVFIPGESAQAERSAGACKGSETLAQAFEDGFAAGLDAAAKAGFAKGNAAKVKLAGVIDAHGGFLGAVPHPHDAGRVKAFVDFQNDVTAKDIKLATREGMRSIEHVKRYTTTGMATDQGKLSNMNALAIASEALGKPIPAVGLTTFRQPYTPISFGAMANHSRGDLFDPVRKTATHAWAESQGAVFEDVGLWKRAWYFPKAGEDMHQAVLRECKTVRDSAGVFDASTLGKIEVVGPDAAAFMNILYTNPWSKLEVGRCRYGLMLNEAGFVMDDGVVGRIAEDRFHVTTTTGGAPRVLNHMEDYLQTEFPNLKVALTSTTEQYSVVAVQGPNARKIIAPLIEGIDISNEAMPHMSVRLGKMCGVPTRLFRMSFTGELGFEVNVPADYGQAVWEAIWAEAQKYDACAYGTETMHVLRAEKGYIIVGQETDGTVTPNDLGLDWAIGKAKPDFVGKRSLTRPDLVKADRKQLVGLLTVDAAKVLEEGAQITLIGNPPPGTSALGHVTSSYQSAVLGRSFALAIVSAGRARTGETLYVPMPDGPIAVTVTDPVFYDKEGAKLHV